MKAQTKIDLRASDLYDPTPHYDTAVTPDGEMLRAGQAYFQRADFTTTQYKNLREDYGLYHDTRLGEAELFDAIVNESGGWMLPTERRYQEQTGTGKGMSEGADRDSGGASYLFTRMYKRGTARNLGSSPRLYFDLEPAMRTTSVHYGHDLYGRVSEFESSHIANPSDWAKSIDSSNERLIKNGMNVLEHLKAIEFGNATAAASFVRKLTTKFGPTNPYNGKRWDEVVTSSGKSGE
jgi:hypothetical protein